MNYQIAAQGIVENLQNEHKQVEQAAADCAERAMSLEDRIARMHAATYANQHPGIPLAAIQTIFRRAFADKRAEETDEYNGCGY